MNAYVLAGYGITVAAIALYGVRVLLRERAARRLLGRDGPWQAR